MDRASVPSASARLGAYGCEVTVVERAPGLREGGQAVDFKGSLQLEVLERFGVAERVRALRTPTTDNVIVDAAGRPRAVIPGAFTGGDLEVGRGDLVRVLHGAAVGAGASFAFASGRPDLGRGGLERSRAALVEAYTGGGWEVPRQLEGVTEDYATGADLGEYPEPASGRPS
jgi:hypothetical protein